MGFLLYYIMLLLIIYHLELLTAVHMVTVCELKKGHQFIKTEASKYIKTMVQIFND